MLKVSVVTPYFPTPEHPNEGRSAFQTIVRLRDSADVEVYRTQASYPKYLQPRPNGERPCDTANAPVTVHYLCYPALPLLTRPLNWYAVCRLLLPDLRRRKPDVLLNYWLYPEGYAAMQLGRTLGIPVIVGAIGSDLCARRDPLTKLLTRAVLRGADAVISVSDDLRRRAIAAGAEPGKVTTIRNGCDRRVFAPMKQTAALQSLNLSNKIRHIVFVGSLARHKGVFDLIMAVRILRATGHLVHLHMLGEGPSQAQLAASVARYNLESCVHFEGVQPDKQVATFLCAASVFCLPSLREGCPNAILEAMSLRHSRRLHRCWRSSGDSVTGSRCANAARRSREPGPCPVHGSCSLRHTEVWEAFRHGRR